MAQNDELAGYVLEAAWRSIVAFYRRRLHASDLATQRHGGGGRFFAMSSPRYQINKQLKRCDYSAPDHTSEGTTRWKMVNPTAPGDMTATIINRDMTPEINDPSFHLFCRFVHVIRLGQDVLPEGVRISSGVLPDTQRTELVRLDDIGAPGGVPQGASLDFMTGQGELITLDMTLEQALGLFAVWPVSKLKFAEIIARAEVPNPLHRLCMESWSCRGDELYVVYAAEIVDVPGRVKQARALIEGMAAHVHSMVAWCVSPGDLHRMGGLEPWAWEMLERADVPGAMRSVCAQILAHLITDSGQRAHLERVVLGQFQADDLAALVPHLSERGLHTLGDDVLLELGRSSHHPPLHAIIASRIDFLEVLNDEVAPVYERDVALRGFLMLGEADLLTRHLPELITRVRDEHAPGMIATLSEMAPAWLWEDAAFYRAVHARIAALPGFDELVEACALRDYAAPDARRARLWEVLGRVCLDAHPPRYKDLEPAIMLDVLLYKDSVDGERATVPTWRAWLGQLTFAEVLAFWREERTFIDELRTIHRVFYLSRVKTDVLYDRSLRGELLAKITRKMRAQAPLEPSLSWLLDKVVVKLCDYDPDVFASAHDRDQLTQSLEAYGAFVSRSGPRAGAITVLHTLSEDMPTDLKAWCTGMMNTWKAELSTDELAGGLTHVQGGDRVGGLSLDVEDVI